MKNNIFILLALLVVFTMIVSGCANSTKLEPIETSGLPNEREVISRVRIDNFLIEVYKSYAEVVGYDGTAEKLIIPTVAEGRAVLSIGKSAFAGNEVIKSVKFPDLLRVIKNYAFDELVRILERKQRWKIPAFSRKTRNRSLE